MSRFGLIAAASALVACANGSGALADACRRPDGKKARPIECRPDQRLEPYDPARLRAGRRPGSIDLGNGTELTVGGRVRMEYDTRR